jgi:5'-nucleotidase
MKRRKFIQQTSLLAGAALVAPTLMSAKKDASTKLVILHTNDTHSNIEPFSSTHPKFPNLGGVAKRATLINQIRSEEANVLLLDAGDIFQGTPYFNKYKGVLEMKVMNEMKYDVVTLGNHDFDIGISGYVQAKKHAAFKVVNCNYQLDKTALKELVTPHTIIKRGGLKIGIVGVGIDLNGLIANDVAQQITYMDPIVAVQKEVTMLRSKGCDYIICLSHLGFDYPNENKVSDKVLAQNTTGIDLIIGGHTHTFLGSAIAVKNKNGENTLINQVGYAGLFLGRIDVTFQQGIKSDTSSAAISVQHNLTV